jgi:glycosyltransferase involved in cell wall biosynthesis
MSNSSNNSNAPQISVVVTAHNMETCLEQCLNSIRSQTFRQFSCLVVNDGSTDGTAAVAAAVAKADARFSVVETPGLGAGGARNRGLDWAVQAGTPYFMLLDGDDVFHPTMFEKLHSAAESAQAQLTICNMQEMDDATGEFTQVAWALKHSQLPANAAFNGWRDMPGNIFAAFMGWPWDKLYRTEFVMGLGLRFPEDLSNSEDALFAFPALACANRIAVVDEILIDHRMGRGNTVSSSRLQEPYAFYEVICRLKGFLKKHSLWEGLGHDFLCWALDWTLWNIETIGNDATQLEMAQRLRDGGLPELELTQHEPEYFTGYPRSMARYTDLMNKLDPTRQDNGPLGTCRKLPFGEYKPWCFKNYFGKALAILKAKGQAPSEW